MTIFIETDFVPSCVDLCNVSVGQLLPETEIQQQPLTDCVQRFLARGVGMRSLSTNNR